MTAGDGSDQLANRLTAALDQPLETIRKCETFLGEVIGAALERDPGDRVRSRNLTAKLLTRIMRDNRCAAVLSLTGYAVQATTLVASVFEVAFTVGYIRDEVDRADEWMNYEDPTRPFRGVKHMIQDVIGRYGRENKQAAIKSKYLTYRQLCQVKHAHPDVERSFGIEEDEDRSTLTVGPIANDASIRMSWFALTHAAGLTTVGAYPVIEHYVAAERQASLGSLLREINEAIDEQNRHAYENEWNRDPHPGQWKL